RVVLLSNRYFEQRFGRNPSAIGRSLAIAGTAYTVIGVLPVKFHLPSTFQGEDQVKPDLWAPLSRLGNAAADEKALRLQVAARLKPGITLARARADMEAVMQRVTASDKDLEG